MKTPRHPNSLKNLQPPYKPGDEWTGNAGGRPKKRPLTDEYFADLERPMPPKMCKKLDLPIGSTFARGHARQRNLDGLESGGYLASKEMREAIEGKAPIRLEIQGTERKEVTLEVIFRKRTVQSSKD
jgi:hypothetical protein